MNIHNLLALCVLPGLLIVIVIVIVILKALRDAVHSQKSKNIRKCTEIRD